MYWGNTKGKLSRFKEGWTFLYTFLKSRNLLKKCKRLYHSSKTDGGWHSMIKHDNHHQAFSNVNENVACVYTRQKKTFIDSCNLTISIFPSFAIWSILSQFDTMAIGRENPAHIHTLHLIKFTAQKIKLFHFASNNIWSFMLQFEITAYIRRVLFHTDLHRSFIILIKNVIVQIVCFL